jgi:hypothetical protein
MSTPRCHHQIVPLLTELAVTFACACFLVGVVLWVWSSLEMVR